MMWLTRGDVYSQQWCSKKLQGQDKDRLLFQDQDHFFKTKAIKTDFLKTI